MTGLCIYIKPAYVRVNLSDVIFISLSIPSPVGPRFFVHAEMGAYVLNEQSFHHCCQLLLQQSEQLKDGWTWETIQVRTSSAGVYKATSSMVCG